MAAASTHDATMPTLAIPLSPVSLRVQPTPIHPLVHEDMKAVTQDKQDRFMWEGSDDVWVMGPLGDALLRKLQHAQSGTLNGPSSSRSRRGDRSPLRSVPAFARRLRCQSGRMDAACRCLCSKYDPRLVVPVSLFSMSGITNDMRPAAERLLEECEYFPSGITRKDILFDTAAAAAPPGVPVTKGVCTKAGVSDACHLVSFKVRGYLKDVSPLDKSNPETASIKAKLDHAEFEVNKKLLSKLLTWCEDMRALKIDQVNWKEEDGGPAKFDPGDTMRSLASTMSRPGTGDGTKSKLGDTTKSKLDAGETAKSSRPDIGLKRMGKPYITCQCGHAEVWHEDPSKKDRRDPSIPSATRSTTRSFQTQRFGRNPESMYGAMEASATMTGGVLRKTASSILLSTG